MMAYSENFVSETWDCLNCAGSGKVSRFLFGKRQCSICEGRGKRIFTYDPEIPKDMIDRIRTESYYRFEPSVTLADILGPLFSLKGF